MQVHRIYYVLHVDTLRSVYNNYKNHFQVSYKIIEVV